MLLTQHAGMMIFTIIFRPLVKSVGFGWAIKVIAIIVLVGQLSFDRRHEAAPIT